MKSIKTDEWIALIALIVSIFSIYLSVHQFNVTSEFNSQQQAQAIMHDKLSVRPILRFNIEYTKASPWIGISIINKGIGPAIIIKYTKHYKGNYFSNFGDLNEYLKKSKSIFWNEKFPYWNELKSEQVLLPNDEIKLWYIETTNGSNFKLATNVLNDLQITLFYSTIYKDTLKTVFP